MGCAIELVTTEHKNKILDGWSLDVFGGRRRAGLGISKDIFKKNMFEIDAGIFVTQDVYDLLEGNLALKPSIGISGRF